MPLMRVSALNGISSTPDCVLSGGPATAAPTSTPAPIGTGSLEIPLPVRFTPRCSASETIDLPSVVSSASEDSSAAHDATWEGTQANHRPPRCPRLGSDCLPPGRVTGLASVPDLDLLVVAPAVPPKAGSGAVGATGAPADPSTIELKAKKLFDSGAITFHHRRS